ncbi:ubiquitin domain-containing protein 2-like [Eriocheir sinensis]|uniref:ubiquitin domain-containing protein 2-like n=1 Tax=Eriocheir sinensis TaxID=95602 RepID=UPI0021C86F4F|nr:ubiquitin domain-containing protein 2-like [Eriocheir sinensis]XP_050733760.1 ubiquitin domain-containing protein 2-like [Eriocheir sinensis]
MGGCVGAPREATPSTTSPGGGATLLTGKNVPLRHERIRWKSDMPLTENQVRSKRDEFWDTAPAFEGRKEIWDALKAAAMAIESHDYNLAQAIVDGANITLPNGALTDCYDELGTRYQLPVYCLSFPLNILQSSPDKEGQVEPAEGSIEGEALVLRVRLSTTSIDTRLTVRSTDTIATAKKKLDLQEDLEGRRQRWFYCGKLLGDRLLICECNIHPSFIIQAIISEEALSAVGS